MARNCGCGGASCGCNVEAGDGILVNGIGTAEDPFVITAEIGNLGLAISFQDTTTINFSTTGTGTVSDPMTVTADVLPLKFPSYTTAGRPSATASGAGAYYYDTTLSKPVWSTGTVWKDAAGTTV
jgi:hypothetical protein